MEPTAEFKRAAELRPDTWVPACGGHEEPAGGYLYVFNHATLQHGWLNLATDIVQFDSPFFRSATWPPEELA